MSEQERKATSPATTESVPEAKGKRGEWYGEGLLFVLGVFAASRLFYFALGALFTGFLPVGGFNLLSADVPFGTMNTWSHWDGEWYAKLAANGYEPYTPSSPAFFPLYPLLLRSFAELFGGPLTMPGLSVWGVLVSLLALPFGFYFVYRIAEHGWGASVARKTLPILAFFPTAFFFNAVYTESLFLALSAGSLWALRVRRDLLLACLLAGFATATRNVGLFLMVPIAYEWFRSMETYGRWRGAYLALAPSGLIGYMLFLWIGFGNPIYFYTAQEQWNRGPSDPISFVANVFIEAFWGVVRFFNPEAIGATDLENVMIHLSAARDTYNLLFLVGSVALLIVGLRVLPLTLSAYTFLLLVPAALYGTPDTPLMGFPRYILVAFPLFITFAVWLERREDSQLATVSWLWFSTLASLVFCALFVSWRFVA